MSNKDFDSKKGGKFANKGRTRDEKDDLIEFVVSFRRVAKTVSGGTNFSFSVLVIVGNCAGKIGIGKGKDKELNNAKIKAFRKARNSMFRVAIKKTGSLHHDIKFKYCSSIILMKKARKGTGIIAGGVLRNLCECLGITDIVAKSYGSSNKYNTLFAAIEGLKLISNPKKIAERRNIRIGDILERKQENQLIS